MCCVRHTFPSRIIHSSRSRALICCHRWEGITNSSLLFQTQQTMVIIHKRRGPLEGESQHVKKIHIQRWFKGGGRWALRGGESAARNAGDGAGVAFLHYLPNQSATPQSSQWASTMCTCQIIASNALGGDCLWQTATAQRATSRTARSETYWQPFVRPPACDYSNQRRIADLTYGRVHPGSSEERIPYDWLENKKI